MNPILVHAVFAGKRGAEQAVKRSSSESWNATEKLYEIVPDASKKQLQRAIRGQVALDSIIHSDGWRGYNGLIDRATRWVYVEIRKDKSATAASGFFKRLIDQTPFTITQVLTDNGKKFTDRFCATGQRQPTGAHACDRVCANNCIEHRLTRPSSLQTNGMVERFNGRIADVLHTHRFDSAASLKATLKRFLYLYNHHILQNNLHHKTPLQTLQRGYAQQPYLFKKIPRNHPGPDSSVYIYD